MLRSETLFGKRDSNPTATPATSLNASHPAFNTSLNPAAVKSAAAATAAAASQASAGSNEMGSKLIVGPNIKLKGVEINDCDTLVVEGRVEATIDSRVIQIAENGAFKGSADIDLAEIRGHFDGDLTVRNKLVIYATGKVSGKIRYGKLVIEEGGQLSGDVQVNNGAAVQEMAQTKTA